MPKIFLVVLLIGLLLPATGYAQDSFVIQLPELTGPYAVGKVDRHLIDSDRAEVFTDDADDVRELMVTVYYPADVPEGAEPALYVDETQLETVAVVTGIPPILLSNVSAHSYVDVPLSEAMASYPVLIFSPAFGVQPLLYTSLLEEIASYGYIIVSMSHPYSTAVTIYLDGRIAEQNSAGNIVDVAGARVGEVGSVWVADALFVLDQLEAWHDADSMFAGKLDLDRIGMFGHGFGGAAATEALFLDQRIVAAINMDGVFFGAARTEAVPRPFMLMRSVAPGIIETYLGETGLDEDEVEVKLAEVNTQFMQVINNAAEGYFFQLGDSTYVTYCTDLLQVADVFPLILTDDVVGSIDAARGITIISTYVRVFFDGYLNDAPLTVLDGLADDYPEVTFEKIENN